MRVYVSGPYTKGDVAQNVKNAIDAGQTLIKARQIGREVLGRSQAGT